MRSSVSHLWTSDMSSHELNGDDRVLFWWKDNYIDMFAFGVYAIVSRYFVAIWWGVMFVIMILDLVSGTLRYQLVLKCSDTESYTASQPSFDFICFYFVLSLELCFLCICFWICDNRLGLEWIRTIITVTFNSPHACPITDGSDFSSSTTSTEASSSSSSEDDSQHSYSFSDYDFSELKRDTFVVVVVKWCYLYWTFMYTSFLMR